MREPSGGRRLPVLRISPETTSHRPMSSEERAGDSRRPHPSPCRSAPRARLRRTPPSSSVLSSARGKPDGLIAHVEPGKRRRAAARCRPGSRHRAPALPALTSRLDRHRLQRQEQHRHREERRDPHQRLAQALRRRGCRFHAARDQLLGEVGRQRADQRRSAAQADEVENHQEDGARHRALRGLDRVVHQRERRGEVEDVEEGRAPTTMISAICHVVVWV